MLRMREELEQIEAETLAPYALLSRNSKGRHHHEHEPKHRTAFQRDRDRILHSAAFRSLEYKTQVFVNDAGDYYRTRLTHTLEVAQIGRSLARSLGVNEDLVETICLAHDLGHPPFGHAGEGILDKLMEDHGGFNHNHQSYRVVTELERRYPDWAGLNLTHETLEGIAKHETEYDLSHVAGLDADLRGSIEAQIANVSDELAYNAHDLDDGFQSGLITAAQVRELEIWRYVCDRAGECDPLNEIQRHLFIRELIGFEVMDMLNATSARLEAIKPQSPEDIQRQPAAIVAHSDEFKAMNRALKDFLYANMYYHYRIVRMKQRAGRFLSDVFKSYVDEPRQLPNQYQALVPEHGLHRVVADYIASMTDRGALLEYRHLFDPLMRP